MRKIRNATEGKRHIIGAHPQVGKQLWPQEGSGAAALVQQMTSHEKALADEDLVAGLTKGNRPLHLLNSIDLQKWVKRISKGSYALPSPYLAGKAVRQLEAKIDRAVQRVFSEATAYGCTPVVAADVWSKGNHGLLGISASVFVKTPTKFILTNVALKPQAFNEVSRGERKLQ
eukprot:GHVU01008347.1.p1 GENE.GHVU01008347.1~~GHVU01008347.1.p1  ORF type:complete len:173 (+),score=25.66 GHVU01008347.1:1023-1541(+)